MKNAITFDKTSKQAFLSFLGKSVDKEGYIVESQTPTQRVISRHGGIQLNEFAAICKGSEIFYKSDITSLIELSDALGR